MTSKSYYKDFDPYKNAINFNNLDQDLQDYLKFLSNSFGELIQKEIDEKKKTESEEPTIYDGGEFFVEDVSGGFFVEDGSDTSINHANIGTISAGVLTSGDGNFKIDLENKRILISGDIEEDEVETYFETSNGAEYSIFECDEQEEAYHLEFDPGWLWSKDDLLELVNHLLDIVEDDEDLDNEACQTPPTSNESSEKALFIITSPYTLSEESVNGIKEVAEKALKEANIDAVPLILSDDLKTRFERP